MGSDYPETTFEKACHRAYYRGREDMREDVIKLIKGCIEVDPSLIKIVEAVEAIE